MTDFELVREYASQGSEDAFATLVSRHVRLVHSAAFRQSGNNHDAEEITQAVFVILARKAGSLRQDTILLGWLLRTTRFVAINARRRQLQRLKMDHHALNETQAETDAAWERMAPMLDESLERLSGKDRDAVVLRYFEQRNFKEIAQIMASTEDGAQKRVTRALEKLRTHLMRRGLLLSTAYIIAAIDAKAVQAAPAQLPTSVMTAVKSGATLTGSLTVLVKASLAALNAARLKTIGLWVIAVPLALTVAWFGVVISLRVSPAMISINPASLRVNPTEISFNPTNMFSRAIATSADGNKLVAAMDGVGSIYTSTDSGTHWNATSAPQGLWKMLASSADGRTLLAVGSDFMFITNGFNIATLGTNSWLYTTTNSGANWTQATDTPTNIFWTAAAASADGRKLVVGATSGTIYTSTDAGGTWTLRGAPKKQWNSIASSADGDRLVAAAVKGGIYTSADSGVTWMPTSAPSDLWWLAVASSADGGKLVAAAKTFNALWTGGGSIYVSSNAGTNWVMTSAPSNHWLSVASSADATTLVAIAAASTSPLEPAGPMCISRDSGITWTLANAPSANWNCVAVSSNGNKIFAGRSFDANYLIVRESKP